MFTGIIEAVGQIQSMQPQGGDVRLYVRTGKLDLGDVKLGDSIAVNGVCLTAIELPGDGFWADVSQETIRRTALASLKPGSRVNLEKALTPTTRLGWPPGQRPCRRRRQGTVAASGCPLLAFPR